MFKNLLFCKSDIPDKLLYPDKPLVIFDFDGTICDSFYSTIQIINFLAGKYHFNKIDTNQILAHRSIELKQLIKELNLSKFQTIKLANQARRLIENRVYDIHCFKGIPELLKALKQNKINLGILTVNTKETVKKFLTEHNILFFEFITSSRNIFGKEKVLKKVIKHLHITNSENIFYVGDEPNDIKASQASKINSIAVTWGYSSANLLNKYKPTFIVNSPKEILPIILK